MIKKYSISLHGHATSISLEPEFWDVLCQIASERRLSVAALIREIDDTRSSMNSGSLSSQLRLFILRALQQRLSI